MSTNIEKQAKCTECGNAELIRDYKTSELICQTCAIVISSPSPSTEPEWRAFDQEQQEKLTRVGAPTNWTIHDKGLSTLISWQDRDASGKKLNPEQRANLYRLRKWHRRSKVSDSSERNLSQAFNEMNKISSKLNLPRNVIETSSMIYRQAIKKRLARGRTIRSVAVASIYIACRQCGVIRTLGDVAEAGNITKKGAARSYRFLFNELRPIVPMVNPLGYIGKIVSNLALSGKTERLAAKIFYQASEMKLTGGRGPSGIAAACVYISSQITNEHCTQGEIAKQAQVTEVTIRNRYKELLQLIQINMSL